MCFFLFGQFFALTRPHNFWEAGNEDASMAELSDSSESDDEEDGEENVTTNGLGDVIAKAWSLRAQKLHHDYSITAWTLSVYPEVYEDAKISITGEHKEAIERVVRKLFKYPYANHITSVKGMSEDEIVDTFWDEFKMFRNKSGSMMRLHVGTVKLLPRASLIFGMRSTQGITLRCLGWWHVYHAPQIQELGHVRGIGVV